MQLLPALQAIFPKVRRLHSRKTSRYQWLTSSVLNSRSREVSRQTAGENEFRVSLGESQSEGSLAKPVVIGLLSGLGSQQRKLVVNGLAEEAARVWLSKPGLRQSSLSHERNRLSHVTGKIQGILQIWRDETDLLHSITEQIQYFGIIIP